MKSRSWFASPALALVCASLAVVAVGVTPNAQGVTIGLSGTSSPQTATFTPSGSSDVVQVEFSADLDEADIPAYGGSITNRSLSRGSAPGAIPVNGSKKAKSSPQFNVGFEGLNHYQQRYSRGGNQFSIEPPDQGLCVGNGFVLEAVNDVLNVYNTAGQSVLPDNTATNIVSGFPRNVNHAVDLNSFYGYLPAINRSTGFAGPEITDPSCLYDAATQRWFMVVLTLDRTNGGALNHVNHLDIAVSKTPDPTGAWNIYKVNVTSDGANNPYAGNACPCLGDYPHIGLDANGFYVTTNAYPWGGNGFNGAQIYAFSKAQLAAGAASVTMVHVDTFGAVNLPSDAGTTQPGFTVWPAQSPGTQFNTDNGGTEFFMSSNAADEATHPVAGFGGNYVSNQIIVWTLSNTSSLNSASPALSLSNRVVSVITYALPPKQKQRGSGSLADKILTPDVAQGACINDTTTVLFNGQTGCWRLLFATQPAHDELISRPDSNDTRMQQVMYANGRLWGALDTALNRDGGDPARRTRLVLINPKRRNRDTCRATGATAMI
jgi:hypothetical protein